jgi:hypothetical protein
MPSELSEKVLLKEAIPLGEEPPSSVSSLEPIDRTAERKLLWKVDRHLVPILFALLYAEVQRPSIYKLTHLYQPCSIH